MASATNVLQRCSILIHTHIRTRILTLTNTILNTLIYSLTQLRWRLLGWRLDTSVPLAPW
jgi:hypothetical protein